MPNDIDVNSLLPLVEKQKQNFKRGVATASRDKRFLDADEDIREATLRSTRLLIEYLEGKTTKTEIINHLESISTPDVQHVVEAVNALDKTLKSKREDFEPLLKELRSIDTDIQKIPVPEIPKPLETIGVKNLKEISDPIKAVEKAIKAQKLDPKIEVKPIVQPADVNIDIEAVVERLKSVEKAIKANKLIVPKTDLEPVVDLLRSLRQDMRLLVEKPIPLPPSVPRRMVQQFLDAEGKAVAVSGDNPMPSAATFGLSTDTPTTGVATASGDTTILSISPGFEVHLYHVSFVPTTSAVDDANVLVKLGSTEILGWRTNFNGAGFARSKKNGQSYWLGSDGDDVVINLSVANSIRWNIDYDIVAA